MRLSNLSVDKESYDVHMCSECKYESLVVRSHTHRPVNEYFYMVKYMLGVGWSTLRPAAHIPSLNV